MIGIFNCCSVALVLVSVWVGVPASVLAKAGQPETATPVAFHVRGSTFRLVKNFEREFGMDIDLLVGDSFATDETDLSRYRLVVLAGFRGSGTDRTKGERERYLENCRKVFAAAKGNNPDMRILISEEESTIFEKEMPELLAEGIVEKDCEMHKYNIYTLSQENMRRLLGYLAVTYLGRPGKVTPPEVAVKEGLYHPDHKALFSSTDEFIAWCGKNGKVTAARPRAIITCSLPHLIDFNRRVVDAIVQEFERQGVLAVVVATSRGGSSEEYIRQYKPDVIVGDFRAGDYSVESLLQLNVPCIQTMRQRGCTIDQWRDDDFPARQSASSVASAETRGSIAPTVVAGKRTNDGTPEPYLPIPDRVERLVGRAVAWIHLANKQNAGKKIVILYPAPPDEGELLMWPRLNVAKSILSLLRGMKRAGYDIRELPADEAELVEWVSDRGRQIADSAPQELDRLARSGTAELLPVETYREWFEAMVPEARREAMIRRRGEMPGNSMVWEDDKGEKYFVIPRIELGNVILVPKLGSVDEERLKQGNRGALIKQLNEDPYLSPSHIGLASYFWQQEGFQADAVVLWGELTLDLLLPLRTLGMRGSDWPDILIGNMPNIRPFSISSLSFSVPAKRRTCAVLVDYLTPAAVEAGLSDELLNLSGDVLKWDSLEDGGLKEKFRTSITEQVCTLHLDRDLGLEPDDQRPLTPEEIRGLGNYLDGLYNQTIDISQHVFGEPPRDDLLTAWIVSCLRGQFLDELDKVIPTRPQNDRLPGGRRKYLREQAIEAVESVLRKGLTPDEAVTALGGKVAQEGLAKELQERFALARELAEGFARTPQEIDNLLVALDGGFVPPGPANPPERNPAVVPTGRNMYTTDPEELPSRPSWELGKQLMDDLLAKKLESTGKYPRKIAFSLNARRSMVDYGLNEAQILYLIGVRPVWDSSNRVRDVELIPPEQLGRPRIDVFIETYHYYSEYLECRARLLDRAIRMVAQLEEPENYVLNNARDVQEKLLATGASPDEAKILCGARIFSLAPGKFGSGTHDELFGSTGLWDSRKELVDVHLAVRDYVYTEGLWGKKAPQAYRGHLAGTDIVLRNLSHHSALSGRCFYSGGNLCLVIEQLTGQQPDFLLCDMRFPGMEKIVTAEDALRSDLRTILFNRKWIEGMMKEGRSGGGRMASLVWHTLGWKINRPNSVSDDVWEEIVDIYIRDSKDLDIRKWFEAENPYAFQEIAERLLETVRKEYWNPDEETLLEIARAYAEAVVRHGSADDFENQKLEQFLEQTLRAPGLEELDDLVDRYAGLRAPTPAVAEQPPPTEVEEESVDKEAVSATEPVEGQKLEPAAAEPSLLKVRWLLAFIAVVVVALFAIGIWKRTGAA